MQPQHKLMGKHSVCQVFYVLRVSVLLNHQLKEKDGQNFLPDLLILM